MAHFPLFLDLSARRCMIFGGGKVALRKVETLCKYQANLEVYAQDVLPEMAQWIPEEKIHRVDLRESRIEDLLAHDDIVIAATSQREINHRISSCCQQQGILVNVIDAPEECTFLFPSVVKKGDISIGINSSGKSPIVSKQVRKDIERAIPGYYGDIAQQLGEVREYVKEHFAQEKDRRSILKKAAALAFAKEEVLSSEELQDIYNSH